MQVNGAFHSVEKSRGISGIMYRTPVIIRKIIPDWPNRTPTHSGCVFLRREGAYSMTGDILHIAKDNDVA